MPDPLDNSQVNTLWNPIIDKQNWQNEFGFIDSFNKPEFSPTAEGLHRGGIGLAAGAAGGGITGRNPWLTGLNTGVGSLAGYLLANTLSKGNPDAGTRAMYENMGSLAGGGAGFGLSMFMRDKRKDNAHKPLDVGIPLPAGATLSLKTAGVLDSIQAQLPAIRLPDSLAGGTVGAIGGLGYHALKDDSDASAKETRRRLWGRLLGGAGIGALGANVVGDRARRYVSNMIYPVGYASNENLNLKPKNLGQVWDAAIMDKPQQPVVQEAQAGKYFPAFTQSKDLQDRGLKLSPNELLARRELLRRGMGVHADNAPSDIWAKQTDGTFSLNPKNQNASEFVKELMYPVTDFGRQKELLTDPQKFVANVNSQPIPGSGLMGYINGGQRVSMYPYNNDTAADDLLLKINDRWDFGLDTGERTKFMTYLKNKYIQGNKGEAMDTNVAYDPIAGTKLPSAETTAVNEFKNKAYEQSLLRRLFLEHVMMKDSPWVSQRMYMRKLPQNKLNRSVNTGYAAIPSTADGQMYNGNVIMAHNPTGASELLSPQSALGKLEKNRYIPNVPEPQLPEGVSKRKEAPWVEPDPIPMEQ